MRIGLHPNIPQSKLFDFVCQILMPSESPASQVLLVRFWHPQVPLEQREALLAQRLKQRKLKAGSHQKSGCQQFIDE